MVKYDTLQKIQKEAVMYKRTGVILTVITGLLISLNTGFVFAQQEQLSAQDAAAEIQWIWGEVVSIDQDAKSFAVKYLDYDTDMEKQMTMSVDDKTVFENSESLAEIKIQDTVSIDYVIGADGRNSARNISVEKIEDIGDVEEQELIPEKVGTGPISPASFDAPAPAAGVVDGPGDISAVGPASPVDSDATAVPVIEAPASEGQVSAVGPVSPTIASAPVVEEESEEYIEED